MEAVTSYNRGLLLIPLFFAADTTVVRFRGSVIFAAFPAPSWAAAAAAAAADNDVDYCDENAVIMKMMLIIAMIIRRIYKVVVNMAAIMMQMG